MILVSQGFFFPVSSRKQTAEGCHRKLYIKGSQKLDLIHYGDAADSKNISQSEARRCDCFDLYKDLIPYKEAWSWQKAAVKIRHTLIDINEDHSDMLIILQHPPVYTLGTRSLEKFLNFDIKNAPYELYRTERGGEVTYHGPGQQISRRKMMKLFLSLGLENLDLDMANGAAKDKLENFTNQLRRILSRIHLARSRIMSKILLGSRILMLQEQNYHPNRILLS